MRTGPYACTTIFSAGDVRGVAGQDGEEAGRGPGMARVWPGRMGRRPGAGWEGPR